RLVLPSLEVHCLGWANTEHDSQDFRIGHPLSQGRIEAGAALFNKRKVEPCREGDRVDKVGVVRISISSGNCRMQPMVQRGDCLSKFECGIEIRVVVVAAVLAPKTRVDGELCQVREPFLSGGASCRAARKRTKRRASKQINIYGRSPSRNQVSSDEGLVAELVIG